MMKIGPIGHFFRNNYEIPSKIQISLNWDNKIRKVNTIKTLQNFLKMHYSVLAR